MTTGLNVKWLLKCVCWVGSRQWVPLLAFTPAGYDRKVGIAQIQPQVAKEAACFAVLSLLGKYQHLGWQFPLGT